MKIKLSSVLVDDQDKALKFYTEVLGFAKKTDIPMREARWLTVVSPKAPDEVELLLEPNGHPAAKTYQRASFQEGIPLTAFAVEDIQSEYERMRANVPPNLPWRCSGGQALPARPLSGNHGGSAAPHDEATSSSRGA